MSNTLTGMPSRTRKLGSSAVYKFTFDVYGTAVHVAFRTEDCDVTIFKIFSLSCWHAFRVFADLLSPRQRQKHLQRLPMPICRIGKVSPHKHYRIQYSLRMNSNYCANLALVQ